MMMTDKAAFPVPALKQLSPQGFLALGKGQIVYIKPVTVMNRQAYALHAADGSALTLADSYDAACAIALQNDLDAVTLQ
ncbi:MAG: DUF1150 family protein [Pseudobdellovibrionaceae bacterium]